MTDWSFLDQLPAPKVPVSDHQDFLRSFAELDEDRHAQIVAALGSEIADAETRRKAQELVTKLVAGVKAIAGAGLLG